ncbi:MAG: RNA pyrophosphohydrolase [Gammaproteobacteria bacterium]|nr:RNA pyrophosphohydrolase [Gammaproteobacteria bacterium]MBT3725771.1 RNA pyrophosphohydrolase [Gammaproteobacteria bacterium]MBT4077512.1 RNA pyrophosphohydrolase [Gammaproteobacteria bacterium]MBT4196059.1 RNA pyrophosphohydrolase [Gammaproteobacteria bacterium]MBT4448806.1 RNA pyrophosphohydrolase [Gammaproteobacteria bacterium]
MIDSDGYRANVGIILSNQHGKLLWAQRMGQDAWQFPQGGVNPEETAEQAMYRELWEEIGLNNDDVEMIASTSSWLRYKLPKRMVRRHSQPVCIGQKQKWYLLRLAAEESSVNLQSTDSPEFEGWKWVDYWYPVDQVVYFKKRVYRCALQQLNKYL